MFGPTTGETEFFDHQNIHVMLLVPEVVGTGVVCRAVKKGCYEVVCTPRFAPRFVCSEGVLPDGCSEVLLRDDST